MLFQKSDNNKENVVAAPPLPECLFRTVMLSSVLGGLVTVGIIAFCVYCKQKEPLSLLIISLFFVLRAVVIVMHWRNGQIVGRYFRCVGITKRRKSYFIECYPMCENGSIDTTASSQTFSVAEDKVSDNLTINADLLLYIDSHHPTVPVAWEQVILG